MQKAIVGAFGRQARASFDDSDKMGAASEMLQSIQWGDDEGK